MIVLAVREEQLAFPLVRLAWLGLPTIVKVERRRGWNKANEANELRWLHLWRLSDATMGIIW